jgi:hypothetical protein
MPMKISSSISKLQKELDNLKKKLDIPKPDKIEDCKSIKQVEQFTLKEIKDFLKKNKIKVKKIDEKYKDDFVKIAWENISNDYNSDYSNEESELASDEEWEHYYE